MKIVLIGLIYLLVLIQGLDSYKEPVGFKWMKSKKLKLMVIYKKGRDIINLKEYNPLPYNDTLETAQSMKSNCNYLGRMVGESDARVAVSGCKNSRKYYVTIFCKNYKNNKFLMNKGKLKLIQSPLINATKDYVETPTDEILKNRLNRQASRFPREMTLNLAVGFDYNFARRHRGTSGAMSEIRRVLTVSQAHFFHPSLTTRIRLNLVSARYYSNERWVATEEVLRYRLRSFASRNANVHANAFFGVESPNTGAIGYGFIEAACSSTSFRVSITEDGGSPALTADTLSHEIGHNLGMRHDFDFRGCTGIMDYGNHPASWSSCSVNSFRNYFNKFNPWCMKSSGSPPATTRPPCRNVHGLCNYFETYASTRWREFCYTINWWGRNLFQTQCLRYCRRCN